MPGSSCSLESNHPSFCAVPHPCYSWLWDCSLLGAVNIFSDREKVWLLERKYNRALPSPLSFARSNSKCNKMWEWEWIAMATKCTLIMKMVPNKREQLALWGRGKGSALRGRGKEKHRTVKFPFFCLLFVAHIGKLNFCFDQLPPRDIWYLPKSRQKKRGAHWI